MIPSPTFKEFRERLYRDYQCEFKTLTLGDDDPPVTFFERIINGIVYECVVAFDDDMVMIEPHYIRHVCERLKIPKEDFGLILG